MAQTLSPPSTEAVAPAPTHGRFQLALVLASVWTLAGAYLDGWAHNWRPGLETFFTPWHAVLYSGYTAAAALLVGAAVLSRRRTGSWRAGLAPGAVGALAGAALFAVSGVGDLIWHSVFGIEVDMEALLSPTHLALVIGVSLIVTGPLRGVWRSDVRVLPWTAAVSAVLFLAVVAFITVYAHPFAHPHAAAGGNSAMFRILKESGPAFGVTAILWSSALIAGPLLLLVRRFVVPVGVGSLLVVSQAVLVGFMQQRMWLVPAALVAGPVIDLMLYRLGRGGELRPLRLLGFGIPAVLFAAYFGVIQITYGLKWTVHLWTGAILLAGLTGLLVSYLVAPPPGGARPAEG